MNLREDSRRWNGSGWISGYGGLGDVPVSIGDDACDVSSASAERSYMTIFRPDMARTSFVGESETANGLAGRGTVAIDGVVGEAALLKLCTCSDESQEAEMRRWNCGE